MNTKHIDFLGLIAVLAFVIYSAAMLFPSKSATVPTAPTAAIPSTTTVASLELPLPAVQKSTPDAGATFVITPN